MSKKEIVAESFFDTPSRLGNGYDCISVVGKPIGRYAHLIPYIIVLPISLPHSFNEMLYRNKDYSEAFKSYIQILEKKKDKILSIVDGCGDRICLMDNDYGEYGFRLRYVFAYWLSCQGYELDPYLQVMIDKYYHLWQVDMYKGRGHYDLTNEFCKEYLESLNWKTSRDVSHQYVMREWLDPADWDTFMQVGTHTRYFGDIIQYAGISYRQLQLGDYFYWTMGCDFLNTDISIINRCTV